MSLTAMGMGAVGAGLGAAAGATSPTPLTFDYKKRGIDFLTGYHGERKGAFQPTLDAMLAQSQGQGLTMRAAERAKLSAGEIARLRASQTGMHRGINLRGIGRGQGVGGGMQEAAHLKASIAGLNAERGMMGQIASADIGKRLDRQQRAMGMATDLFSQETGKENAAIGAQFQSEQDKRMAGSRLHRTLGGAAQGWGASGQAQAAAPPNDGTSWWRTMARG